MSEVDPSVSPPPEPPPEPAPPAAVPVPASAPAIAPPTLLGLLAELAHHIPDLIDVAAAGVNVLIEIRDEIEGLREATELLTVSEEARDGILHKDTATYAIGTEQQGLRVDKIKPGRTMSDSALLKVAYDNGQIGTLGAHNKGLVRMPRPLSESRPSEPSDEPLEPMTDESEEPETTGSDGSAGASS